MKSFLAAISIAIASTTAISAPQKSPPPSDHVTEFKSLVAAASQPKEWTRVYQNSRNQQWAKQYFSVGDIKYDVRKTDSLINPMIGVVDFPIMIRQSEFFASKEDAAASTALASLALPYQIQITYHANGSSWGMHELTYSPLDRGNPLYGSKFSMDRSKLELEKEKAIGSALQRWAR